MHIVKNLNCQTSSNNLDIIEFSLNNSLHMLNSVTRNICHYSNNNFIYISFTCLLFSLFTTIAMPFIVSFNDMTVADETQGPVPCWGFHCHY